MNLKQRKYYPLYLVKQYFSRENLLDVFGIRRKPEVLQLPITSRCNSRCVTCNVWKQKEIVDIDPVKLKEILQDPYFSKVKDVGINGGEITLVPNFEEILNSVLTLKNIRAIYLISNGLLPNKLLPLLESAKKKCNDCGVKLCITISIDGIDEVQANIRGVPNCFSRSLLLLDSFKNDPNRYADRISIGCTLSKNNIPYVVQTDEFLKQYPFYVQYHLAVPNKRIHTFNDAASYYILNDEHSRLLAEEFFLGKFYETSWTDCYSYFCQYYFLKSRGKVRLSSCSFKYRDITIDENLKFYLCATASDEIGDGNKDIISKVVSSDRYRKVHKDVMEHCDSCIHYISNVPTLKGLYYLLLTGFQGRWDWHYKFKIITKV